MQTQIRIKYNKQSGETHGGYWARRKRESLPYVFGAFTPEEWYDAVMAIGSLTWIGVPEFGIPVE